MKTYFNISAYQFLLFSLILFSSCSKQLMVDKEMVSFSETEDTTYNYTSDYAYNLNLIYFIANDRVANPEYEARLSKIMIEGQHFFNDWMKYWGYGDITFGLLKDDVHHRVKIHTIHAEHGSTSYQSGMDGNIKAEIEAYFTQNPEAKTSDHVMVIMAVNERLDQGEDLVTSAPFYATNRYAYAYDYPGMSQDNLGTGGTIGDKATVYIGGLLHEMGHAINLPHNGPNYSQTNSSDFGMTLMGGGNYTYGKSPTFISHFDAATLANCQVFSKEMRSFYTSANVAITDLNATYSSNNIVVSGHFTSSVPVKDVSFYNKPENNPDGYSAITWTVEPGSDNSFSISMPVSEYKEKGNLNYELAIFFHHENGLLTSKSYGFRFLNDVPEIHFGDREYLDRTGWTVEGASLAQGGYEATKVLDGNNSSYWHTSWSDTTIGHPHFITIKTGSSPIMAKGFALLPRPEGGTAGKIKDFTIEISDDGINWSLVYTGSMTVFSSFQNFDLSTPQSFNYFRITSLSDHKNERYASLAEINVYNE